MKLKKDKLIDLSSEEIDQINTILYEELRAEWKDGEPRNMKEIKKLENLLSIFDGRKDVERLRGRFK